MVLGVWGSNLQNVNKDLRAIYKADKDKKLIQVDQSGAEALIVAYLCKPGNFRDLFLYGVKPHVFVALHNFAAKWLEHGFNKAQIAQALNTPIRELKQLPFWKELDSLIKSSDNWPAQQRYYFIAKMVTHASNYSMRAPTFQVNVLEKSEGKIVLTRQEAEASLDNYHRLFPEIRCWHYEIQEKIIATHTLQNLFGYPREFNGDLTESTFKEGYAFIPQSTVGTITNIAYTRLQTFIEDTGKTQWDLLGNCHDSYLLQVPLEDEQQAGQIAKAYLEQDLISPRGEQFKMKAEVQSGFNWGPQKQPPKDADVNDPLIRNKYNLDGLTELKLAT